MRRRREPPEWSALSSAAAGSDRGAVGVDILAGRRVGQDAEVDVGIDHGLACRRARADFEHHRVLAAAVLEAVAVGLARLEAGTVAGPQHVLAGLADQRHLAFEHVDELVLGAVPVALRRPRARRQAQQVDAELGEAGGIAEPGPLARPAGLVIGRRVERAGGLARGGNVDLLRHGSRPAGWLEP